MLIELFYIIIFLVILYFLTKSNKEYFNINTNISGLYINLDKRKDRRDHFKKLKSENPFFKNVNRLPAIEDKKGFIGCGKSHIIALKQLLKQKDEYYIVCEDDLNILNQSYFNNFTSQFDKVKNNPEWDIIVLTPRGISMEGHKSMASNGFMRIYDNQTATGYIIKRKMIPILIKNFSEAVMNLLKGGEYGLYGIDQYWKRLQKAYKFYYYKDVCCGQLPGYSNIENINVDYNSYWGGRKK